MIHHRVRAALRWCVIILGTAFLTSVFFAYLIAFLNSCARAKVELRVP